MTTEGWRHWPFFPTTRVPKDPQTTPLAGMVEGTKGLVSRCLQLQCLPKPRRGHKRLWGARRVRDEASVRQAGVDRGLNRGRRAVGRGGEVPAQAKDWSCSHQTPRSPRRLTPDPEFSVTRVTEASSCLFVDS
eukprot:Hpha_TRINITY_DN16706_c1_g5::TRINITY_DN16706_c1_g5_i1::g.78707::m.78707